MGKEAVRSTLNARLSLLQKDYNVMLYGREVSGTAATARQYMWRTVSCDVGCCSRPCGGCGAGHQRVQHKMCAGWGSQSVCSSLLCSTGGASCVVPCVGVHVVHVLGSVPPHTLAPTRHVQFVPNETSPHYTLAKDGLSFSNGQGPQIMYATHECLRTNASSCLTPASPYYQYTRNGLDMLMKHFFENVGLMIAGNGSDPSLDGPEWEYIWLTRL